MNTANYLQKKGGEEKGIESINVPESLGNNFLSAAPIAKMHDWGGFTMAEKLLTPYIPRFDIVKVPPCFEQKSRDKVKKNKIK